MSRKADIGTARSGRNAQGIALQEYGATALPHSEVHLALMSEDGAMRFAYCALRTAVQLRTAHQNSKEMHRS
jgi:hypothetical protein